MKNRNIMRAKAKAIYKEKTKGIPKKQRIPFKQFFAKIINKKKLESIESDSEESQEDFNLDDIINEIDNESFDQEDDYDE